MENAQMPQATPVPINALFVGDIVSQLVMVLDTDTVAELAQKVAHHVVGKRIAPRASPMVVYLEGGRELAMGMTVAQAGITPMQSVYVKYAN